LAFKEKRVWSFSPIVSLVVRVSGNANRRDGLGDCQTDNQLSWLILILVIVVSTLVMSYDLNETTQGSVQRSIILFATSVTGYVVALRMLLINKSQAGS
jgi:hypothetical protein